MSNEDYEEGYRRGREGTYESDPMDFIVDIMSETIPGCREAREERNQDLGSGYREGTRDRLRAEYEEEEEEDDDDDDDDEYDDDDE